MLRAIPCLLLLLSPAPGAWAQENVQRILAHPDMGLEQLVDSLDRAILWDKHETGPDRQQLSEALDRYTLRKDTLRRAWTAYYLGRVLLMENALPEAREQFAIANDLFTRSDDARGRNRCAFGKAEATVQGGDLSGGLPGLQQAWHEGERLGDTLVMVEALGQLGFIAGLQHNLPGARGYYEQSIRLAAAFDWCFQWVNQLRSMGNAWKEDAELDRAVIFLERADSVLAACAPEERYYRAMVQVERAMVDIDRGRRKAALAQLEDAQRTFDSLEVHTWSSYTLATRAELLLNEGLPQQALRLAERGLLIADRNGLMKERGDNLRQLHRIAAALGDHRKAYAYHVMLQEADSAYITREGISRMASLEAQFEREKELIADSLLHAQERVQDRLVTGQEVRRQRTQRNVLLGFAAFGIVFAVVDYRRRRRIKLEHARSEALLLNILPEEVAEELKTRGEAEAVHFDQVTVLFTDFKGFTTMSELLSPKDLVKDIHDCFSAFDGITEEYGIEKIKTIGDAYMAAGGLPTPNTTHAQDVIKAALEMRDFIAEGKARKVAAGLPYFEVRIGIHTGPVVAGIVGVKKFQYDIWGDTVNTASRMESSGEVGQVNISEATYALVKDDPSFRFDPRGKVQAKGKGEMEMYFVRRSDEGA